MTEQGKTAREWSDLLFEGCPHATYWHCDTCREEGITAAMAQARAEALEEAAEVADRSDFVRIIRDEWPEHAKEVTATRLVGHMVADEISVGIRALATKPTKDPTSP